MNRLIIGSVFLLFCYVVQAQVKSPIDSQATPLTRALFNNLDSIAQKQILFGHQSATSYGHSWRDEPNRSDVKDVVGAHPAVIGADFGGLTSADENQVKSSMEEVRQTLQDTYRRGGVVTICWHSNNPVNDETFYYERNPVAAVSQILPGAEFHDKYKTYLDRIAEVARTSVTDEGECIPFIFRPFHEFDGDWFWWGKSHCTREQFVELWRFTVDYLRYKQQVHSILYAFSPDCRFNTSDEFLERYPGDDYVDMLGIDDYWDFRPDGANNPSLALEKLKIVSRLAQEKGKLAAFTETGLEGVKQKDWYTKVLLPILKDKELKLAYVLVWRNAHDIENHYYTPYPGHPATDDFIKFYKDKRTLFEDGLPAMYK